jgi:endonuclease/exonuclease/phosphatase family metal-dependent hydrolase
MGDFNDDFSRKNYGNRKNEKVNDGLRDLQSRYHNTWDLAKGKNIEADDRKLTFDRALKEGIGTRDFKEAREDYLTAGSAEKKAKALDKLRNIYEDIAGRGPTHLTAGSGKGTRFDNILVSRGVLVDSWETDYGADGSDHQPVSVDIVV